MRSSLALVIAGGVMLAARAAHADASSTVTVTLTPQGQAVAAGLGETPQQLQSQIQQKVENTFELTDINKFLRDFTDATSFSNRGLGVDYASASTDFMIGLAGNVAVSGDSDITSSDHPTGGAAANLALMLGGNLKGLGLPGWMLYVNGFYESDKTGDNGDQLSGSLTSAGAHLQYRLVAPEADSGTAVALRWIGIDVTTGAEYTRWALTANGTLTNDYTFTGNGQSATVAVASAGNLALTSNTFTIPLEITTGFRIVELLSIYGGGGVDFTVGNTSINSNLNGNATASDGTPLGTVAITATGSNTGSPAAFRALAGAQLNLWRLKIFAQGNLSQNSTMSVSFGLRLLM